MELIYHLIEKALPKLGDTENIPLKDKTVVCKFYVPEYCWTYFVFEGEILPESHAKTTNNHDIKFYGMACNEHRRLEHIRLSKLLDTQRLNISVLRDTHIICEPYVEVGRLGQYVINNCFGKPDTSLPLIAYQQYNVDKVKKIAQSWCETWIAIAEHNQSVQHFTHINEDSFYHCGNSAHLQQQLLKPNYTCGRSLTLGNLCFIRAVPNLDRYLIIKENIVFDIWPLETLARFNTFINNIEKLQNYKKAQCKAIGRSYDQPLGHDLIWC